MSCFSICCCLLIAILLLLCFSLLLRCILLIFVSIFGLIVVALVFIFGIMIDFFLGFISITMIFSAFIRILRYFFFGFIVVGSEDDLLNCLSLLFACLLIKLDGRFLISLLSHNSYFEIAIPLNDLFHLFSALVRRLIFWASLQSVRISVRTIPFWPSHLCIHGVVLLVIQFWWQIADTIHFSEWWYVWIE